MPAAVSPSLRALFDATIDSIEKLDLVVALRASPERRLALHDLLRHVDVAGREELRRLAQELGAGSPRLVLDLHEDLLVLPAQTPAIESALAELIELNERDRPTLVVAIAESAIDRLRELAGRAFTGGFGARKKPDGK